MDDKKLCECFGGSHLYGLNNADSDIDYRGIYMSVDPKFILGTGRDNEQRKQNAALKEDIVYKELSHWVRLLAQSNTEAYELLFAPLPVFSICEDEFIMFRSNAQQFLDSRRLFNCLRGYAQSEFRLAKGERVGVLGSKRKMALEKYGYSHRNASHLLRLLWTGIEFFKSDRYVVNVNDFGKDIFDYIYNVKSRPETYSVELLAKDYADLDKQIVSAYEARKKNYMFNEKMANDLLLHCYLPSLNLAAKLP